VPEKLITHDPIAYCIVLLLLYSGL